MEDTRQLSAIMFTDIAGYTALMGKDEERALAWLRKNREIQKPLIEKHNGKYLKEMGDGILAQFSSAYNSVKCALEIQRQAREEFEGQIKIGIHLGDVTIENGDVIGDGVNIASRLEAIADPGGIYISESVHKAIRGRGEIISHYLGELELKNVDYAVKTYVVTGEGQPKPRDLGQKQLKGHWAAEFRRRNVHRAAFVYIIVAFLITQIAKTVLPLLELPSSIINYLVVALVMLFPTAMWLAWSYELSPDGFIRTSSRKSWENPYTDAQKKPLTNNLIMGILVVVILFMYFFPQVQAVNQNNSSVPDKSIAVLYFDNMSGDEDQEYFSDGITEEIIAQLSRLTDLKVVSRTSVEPYKGKASNIRTIASELGVRTVLEGSVRRSGDQLRITAQLIDPETDEHLWTEEFNSEMDDIFKIQTQVAMTIAEKFNVTLSAKEELRIETPPTTNTDAYDLFLRANSIAWKGSGTGVGANTTNQERAVKYLREAIELDPNYGQAMALLSGTYLRLYRLKLEHSNLLDSAMYFALKAANNAPDHPEGYIRLGQVSQYIDGKKEAIRWFQRANDLQSGAADWYIAQLSGIVETAKSYYQRIRSSPRDIDAYVSLISLYHSLGKKDSVNKYIELAKEISPESPALNWVLVFKYTIEGDVENTSYYAQREYSEDSLGYNKSMAVVHFWRREWEKAEEYYAKTTYRDSDLGLVLLKTGRVDSARKLIRASLEYNRSLGKRAWPFNEIRALVMLGNLDEAYNLMKQQSLEDYGFVWFSTSPFYDDIREQPRFVQILNMYEEQVEEAMELIQVELDDLSP